MRWLLLTLAFVLGSCGGGGDDAPAAPISLSPGAYSVQANDPAELGEMLVGPDMAAVYFASRSIIGFGRWQSAGQRLTMTMNALPVVVDDLRNDFPAAKTSLNTRNLELEAGPNDSFSGGGTVMSRRAREAPDIATLPRNWHFRNLYRWGAQFLDYEIQIDIDTAGVLSGFDVNGCNFNGQLSPTAGPLYAVTIFAFNCGATQRCIENANYSGFGYLDRASNPNRLVLFAVDRDLRLGLQLQVVPR